MKFKPVEMNNRILILAKKKDTKVAMLQITNTDYQNYPDDLDFKYKYIRASVVNNNYFQIIEVLIWYR